MSEKAFAAGRVTVGFNGGNSILPDSKEFPDNDFASIQTSDEQLRWDYFGKSIWVQTAKTQALVGFVGGSTLVLPDVVLKVETGFVSLIFTPLDDQPLKQSKHILITALARDKQTGARYGDKPDDNSGTAPLLIDQPVQPTRLLSVGTAPLLLEPVRATIKINGLPPQSIRPLDHYGMPKKETLTADKDGIFTIDGRYRAYYYEVRR